jgi:hypothetical protein
MILSTKYRHAGRWRANREQRGFQVGKTNQHPPMDEFERLVRRVRKKK